MAEKCWCGRVLLEPQIIKGFLDGETTTRSAQCPTHGADYVWRPCGLERVEIINGRRFCPIRSLSPHTREEVNVRICAACPVPAPLEALNRARMHCGWLLSEFQDGEVQGKPADIVESTQAVYDLCTAALEQAKGEEAHDAT